MGPWPTGYEPTRTNIQESQEDIAPGPAQQAGDPLCAILDISESRPVPRNPGLTLISDLLP
jgi:hypothetical protein